MIIFNITKFKFPKISIMMPMIFSGVFLMKYSSRIECDFKSYQLSRYNYLDNFKNKK